MEGLIRDICVPPDCLLQSWCSRDWCMFRVALRRLSSCEAPLQAMAVRLQVLHASALTFVPAARCGLHQWLQSGLVLASRWPCHFHVCAWCSPAQRSQ